MHHVNEYLLADPQMEHLERYTLTDGGYTRPELFNWDDTIRLGVLDIEIGLWEVFGKRKP